MKRELRRTKSERTQGNVVEIFSGIQGEGIHVGRRQIFLRLAGCNLACDYCDQPEARTVPAFALIERTAGRRDFIAARNPLGVERCARAILKLDRPRGLHHAVSLTGGEPLMQAGFLAALLPILRRAGLRVLLETNGTRPEEFRALRHWWISLAWTSNCGRPRAARCRRRPPEVPPPGRGRRTRSLRQGGGVLAHDRRGDRARGWDDRGDQALGAAGGAARDPARPADSGAAGPGAPARTPGGRRESAAGTPRDPADAQDHRAEVKDGPARITGSTRRFFPIRVIPLSCQRGVDAEEVQILPSLPTDDRGE